MSRLQLDRSRLAGRFAGRMSPTVAAATSRDGRPDRRAGRPCLALCTTGTSTGELDVSGEAVVDGGRMRTAGIVFGAGIAVTGLAVLVWPAATVVVLGVWLGLGMVLFGAKELVIGLGGGGGGSRLWTMAVGGVSIVAGLVVLFAPILTAATIGTLIGFAWLADGIIALVAVLLVPERRVVRAAFGLLSVVAGGSVLAQPALSLVALTWFAGLWTLVLGLVVVATALLARTDES